MSEHQHEPGWRPDQVPPPEYPPPAPPPPDEADEADEADEPNGPAEAGLRARDLTTQRPGDKPTAWQRAMAERKAAQDDPGDADEIGPGCQPTEPLTDKARAELLRCAEAFENQARKLREIVGE